MTRLGWQALLLIPLLAGIVGFARLLRGWDEDRPRTPILRFLVASVLAHLGLLFLLDLVLVTVPVVAAHREFLRDVVLRTFSVGPVSRAPRGSWETLPDGPPVAEPLAGVAPAPTAGLAFAPELKAMTPTLPESVARSLPPSRLLFLPRHESPPMGPTAVNMPRTFVLAPEPAALEAPSLSSSKPAPEREPVASAATIEHREPELPAGVNPPASLSPIPPQLPDLSPAHVPIPTTEPARAEPPPPRNRPRLAPIAPEAEAPAPAPAGGGKERPLSEPAMSLDRADTVAIPARAATVPGPPPSALPIASLPRHVPDLVLPDRPPALGPIRPPRLAPADALEPPARRRVGAIPIPKDATTAETGPRDLAPPRAAARDLPVDRPSAPRPREPLAVARLEPPRMAREPKAKLPPQPLPTPHPVVRPEPVMETAEPEVQFAMRSPEARKVLVPALGGNTASEAAVERGLAWLAAHQGPDGNWRLNQLHCKGHTCSEAGEVNSDAAATGLALMAFLGAGHAPGKGSYAEPVRRGVAWLVAHQREDGALADPGGAQMYGHALAAIALCEALGLGGERSLRAPAERAVRFIIEAQDPGSGGWRYSPRGGGDTSVFGWQVMALKSGEMAGLPVPVAAYDQARRWLDSVGAGPGRLLYGYQPGHEPTPSMTAEGLLCRQYLGVPRQAPTMVAGGAFLKNHTPDWKARHSYYWYYGTQVMFHLQGDGWVAWNGKLRDPLIGAQVKDGPAAGSWDTQKPSADRWGKDGGRLYETALSLLMLEVYYRHLPLYQRLGDDPPRP